MKWISNDVATVAIGLAASMGQFLLCAGEKGKRYALPHSRIMMHQPSGGLGGTASDIRIQAEQSLHIKSTMQKLIAEHTGQTLEQIEADSDRDRWFTAEQALTYGFIDHGTQPRQRVVLEVRTDDPREQPGTNDLVRVGVQVHWKCDREQVRVTIPSARDLWGER